MTVSREQFRDAMARLGAAVNIVTTDGTAGRAGFTASAVCSVTDDPPTLLVCLNRSSRGSAANAAASRWHVPAGGGGIPVSGAANWWVSRAKAWGGIERTPDAPANRLAVISATELPSGDTAPMPVIMIESRAAAAALVMRPLPGWRHRPGRAGFQRPTDNDATTAKHRRRDHGPPRHSPAR
jgi:hypothetical protein